MLFAIFLPGCVFSQSSAVSSRAVSLEQIKKQIHRAAPAVLKVGAARVEITPPVGTPLAGYSKRHGKPSTGIRDPLYVRAVAISDDEDTVVIVSADLLVFPQPVAEMILDRISRETGLPRWAIILSATHTHSGSGAIGHGFLHEQVFGAYDPKIVEGIAGRILWSVKQAMEKRQPVRWALVRQEDFLARRMENRAVAQGPVDPSLSAVLFEEQKGTPAVVLVHAAAHPTLMDSQDLRFSGDFPGELCRLLESAYPGSVCLFLNEAAGDTRPKDSIGKDAEERIQRFGGLLAEGVTALLSRAELRAKGSVAVWGAWYSLPPPQIWLGWIPLSPQIGRMMRPTSVFLSLAALDDLLWVPLSAEMTAEVGRQLTEKLSRFCVQPLLVGYANGYIGYVVTAERYNNRSYEDSMNWYGPGLGDLLIGRIQELASLYFEKSSR